MKRLSFVPLVLAVTMLTTIAFAAAEKKAGIFQELAASGVSGKVDLVGVAQKGETSIHGQARNLEPNTEYLVIWYRNTTCSPEAGSETQVVERFTSNPQGMSAFQGKVQIPVADINSVSILRASDLTAQACAPVTAQ